MRQLIQSYKTGEIRLVELPRPQVKRGFILVKTRASLVSVGTEKHMVEMAKKSLIGKALARPDLVKQVIAKVKTEGFMEAYRQAMGRLDTPVPLGYSAAGVVVEVGPGVDGFSVGDLVAITGSGYAGHAEYNLVPELLAVRIPKVQGMGKWENGGVGAEGSGVGIEGLKEEGEKVRTAESENAANFTTSPFNHFPDFLSFEEAAFGALGGIALEAVRMARVQLGDWVAVIGLGLIGQIAVQLLASAGCHVIGMDISQDKVRMALEHGLELGATSSDELILAVREKTRNQGVDSVIILAAAKSNEPLEVASEIARERGVIVAAGLVPLDIPRKTFYDKELELVVSRAWGPGLYDESYAEGGQDYPLAYARWTAQRNVAEFLDQLARGRVSVKHLISHRFPFEDALSAYEMILKGEEPFFGVVLEYLDDKAGSEKVSGGEGKRVVVLRDHGERRPVEGRVGVGFIGAGLFTQGTLLPALKKLMDGKDIELVGVATSTGLRARHVAEKYGFSYFTSDYRDVLDDDRVNAVFILTRHGSHAPLVCEALRAGKHVFVEKPLAVNEEQLREIVNVLNGKNLEDEGLRIEGVRGTEGEKGRKEEKQKVRKEESEEDRNVQTFERSNVETLLMVGFNRRFAPSARWLKERFAFVDEPLAIHMTVNAGYVPPDSWVHDPEEGGGRIVGEVCHFVDLAQYLTGSLPKEVFAVSMDASGYRMSDNVKVTLTMENGSLVSITYVANGDKLFPRERVEVFGGGAVGVIDNFKGAVFYRRGKKERFRGLGVDRGHKGELEAFFEALKRGKQPVELKEYIATTLTTFAIEEAMRNKRIEGVRIEGVRIKG